MPESFDQRLQDYQQRFQDLTEAAREGVERQAPDLLDKLAATAKNIAQRLEDMASDARQREAEKEGREAAPPQSAGTSEPTPPEDRKPDPPPSKPSA